ncbi:hypothetical protein HCN44_001556 [Aphidius gifuensis]|uniref:Uncharacterized protein n=1 Tax=Aphidius gifuensis TaxID=684658 RepID=A0A834XSX2_APHGI|nr:uncharacterized protein LOC122853228 [Aphidius gifuensis]KAF7992231.1 hypothetical protein HCN44_001556 [Aphidius gifuensis]
MIWSLCGWFWILIFLNSAGTHGSLKNEQLTSTRSIKYLGNIVICIVFIKLQCLKFCIFKCINILLDGEYYDDIINASNRHFFGGNSGKNHPSHTLIREIYSDIKKIMRTIPGVATNVSETGHEVGELKRLFYGVLEDIRFLKEQVRVIRHQTSHIWQNVSDARRHLNHMSSSVTGIAKYTNSSIENLTEGYKKVRAVVNGVNSTIENLTKGYRKVRADVSGVNSSIENLTESYEKVRADFSGVNANYGNISDDVRVLKRNNHMVEALLPVVNTFVSDTYVKLDKILSDQESIYSTMVNNENAIRNDISRLERKIDGGFTGFGAEVENNNKNLLNRLEYIISQVIDFRGYIEKVCHQHFPGRIKQISHVNKISKNDTRLTPLVNYIKETYNYLQLRNKTPIIGSGGIGGAGQITGIPGIIDNYLGTFGGVGGFALYPESAVNLTSLLRTIAKEPIFADILPSTMTNLSTTTTTTTGSSLLNYIPSFNDVVSGLDSLGIITTTTQASLIDLIDGLDFDQLLSDFTPTDISSTTTTTTTEIPGAFPIIPGFPPGQYQYPLGTVRPAINLSPIPVFPGPQSPTAQPSVPSNYYQTTPSSYYPTASPNYNSPMPSSYYPSTPPPPNYYSTASPNYNSPMPSNYYPPPPPNYYSTASPNYNSPMPSSYYPSMPPNYNSPTPPSYYTPPPNPTTTTKYPGSIQLFTFPPGLRPPNYPSSMPPNYPSSMPPNYPPSMPPNYPSAMYPAQPNQYYTTTQQPMTLPPGKPPAYPIGTYPAYPGADIPSISNIPGGQGYPNPIPTQPTTSRPFVPPLPTSTPYPPTLIEPVIPLGTGSLMGRCACLCPCNCGCPAIPVAPDPPTTLTPVHSWWSSYDGFPTRISKDTCQCLCACPCPRNSTIIPPSSSSSSPLGSISLQNSQYTSRRSTTLSLYEEAMTTDRWPPEPDSPSRPLLPRPNYNNNNNNNDKPCCQDITNDIRGVKEDIRMMTITMRDEIAIVKQSMMSQIDIKFEELKYILADIHHTHLDYHNENKADAEEIKELIKFEFEQSNNALNTFGQHMQHLTANNMISPQQSRHHLIKPRVNRPAWFNDVKKPLHSNWNITTKTMPAMPGNSTNLQTIKT